ncbi:MAG TPA: hypothetical protein VGP97_24275 [Burkholderiales bacterium]|jgi:hypothetical protein|nr:hypothetical protein [Burkholderiales bacterium]
MRLVHQGEVEDLLTREARSRLPLRRQLLLYLDPFALFKDVSAGRERARWLLIVGSLFAGIAPAEALAADATIVPAAAIAVGCCIALTVAACIVAAYFLLGVSRR